MTHHPSVHPADGDDAPVPRLRLLLVDDHSLFREGLSRLLADESGFELVAQCSSIEEASAVLRAAKPADLEPQAGQAAVDLMLLDFDLGEHTGFDMLRAARALGYAGKILLVTAGMSPTDQVRARGNGASGIFLKHSPPGELVQAIHQVMQGDPWVQSHAEPALPAAPRHAENRADSPSLTLRERAVLRGVFEGRANKEIAAELQVSEGSVKAVLQQLFAKTGVRSRAQLVRIALENRIAYGLDAG